MKNILIPNIFSFDYNYVASYYKNRNVFGLYKPSTVCNNVSYYEPETIIWENDVEDIKEEIDLGYNKKQTVTYSPIGSLQFYPNTYNTYFAYISEEIDSYKRYIWFYFYDENGVLINKSRVKNGDIVNPYIDLCIKCPWEESLYCLSYTFDGKTYYFYAFDKNGNVTEYEYIEKYIKLYIPLPAYYCQLDDTHYLSYYKDNTNIFYILRDGNTLREQKEIDTHDYVTNYIQMKPISQK